MQQMVSLRAAVQSAINTKIVPPYDNGKIRQLGEKIGLKIPFSVSSLMDALERLPPQNVIFDSGPLGPSTVTASAQVAFTSDGFASFRGTIIESGGIGHDY